MPVQKKEGINETISEKFNSLEESLNTIEAILLTEPLTEDSKSKISFHFGRVTELTIVLDKLLKQKGIVH